MRRANVIHTQILLSDLVDEHSPKGFSTALMLAIKNDRLLRPVSWRGTGEAIMYHKGEWYLWRNYDLLKMDSPSWSYRCSELWEVVSIDGELETELGVFSESFGVN